MVTAITASKPAASGRWLFPLAAFSSAALVFAVEPMIGRMALPRLGGSAGVWAASLVFFQAALLVGYLYAHALARYLAPRTQVVMHLCVLAAAALCLPVRLAGLFGEPGGAPALWLLAVLTVSIGAPFAALSATAPLIQVWRARWAGADLDDGPWSLYAASNLGSLVALLAYPIVIEPLSGLARQSLTWSLAYAAFVAMMAAAGSLVWRPVEPDSTQLAVNAPSSVTWIERARWVGLSALPSALLIGVTNAVTSDVGSAPFLWVAPLALYLLTFVIAFRARGPFAPQAVLLVQALALLTACLLMHAVPSLFPLWLAVHFAAFFLTALVCHQQLVARRPGLSGLTDFYFCLSLGGVLGGAASALLAPVLFRTVVEYPAALALSALARPWGLTRPRRLWPWLALGWCLALMTVAVLINRPPAAVAPWVQAIPFSSRGVIILVLAEVAAILALLVRDRGPLFALAAVILIVGNDEARSHMDVLGHWRGFYGVLRESRLTSPGLGGEVHTLANGTTLHGAEAVAPAYRCQPLVYYGHETPIGQVMDREAQSKPAMEVGVVGLGAGTLTAYARTTDRFTVFEINPLVVRIARDARRFAYLTDCAKGRIDIVLGDARRRLLSQPDGRFDTLIVDAFSSDSVPSHLLTLEAVKLYLSKIKPDGVVLLHLSNRNLDLIRPALADGIAAGAITRVQRHFVDPRLPAFRESSEDAVILTRTKAGAALFAGDPRWRAERAGGVAPWTDDHTDLFGALVRRLEGLR